MSGSSPIGETVRRSPPTIRAPRQSNTVGVAFIALAVVGVNQVGAKIAAIFVALFASMAQ
jgi:hypothetical protein